MKNKKINFLLIVCVAIVWGIIIYRVFAAMAVEELPIPETRIKKEAYFKEVNHENDVGRLDLNYPDPFSSNNEIFPDVTVEAKNAITTTKTMKPLVNWPSIALTGYVYNAINKQKIIMVNINGSEQMLTEGQNKNGLKLLKYAGDSIKVQYQNQTKYIRIR